MAQSEIIELLENMSEPLSVGEIALSLNENPKKISRDLNKLLQYKEIDAIEVPKESALKKYKCKHRMRIYFVKGMLGAIVDLKTGKIYGCEEGSKTWYHEKGHLAFAETEWGNRISYYQIFFMMIAVFFGSLALLTNSLPLKIFVLMNALGMIVSYTIEELWAWWWGLREYYRQHPSA